MNFSLCTTKTKEEIIKEFNSNENGLSNEEAKKRLKVCGFNEIKEDGIKPFEIFIRQFKSPFVYLLLMAAIIAFLIGEKMDAGMILIFLFINIILGFIQEYKAERVVFALKKYLPSLTKVMRGGVLEIIDKKFLVPGDIILLEAGDIVPADLRILEVENFLVDESVLSGESSPIRKNSEQLKNPPQEIFKAKNILFAGTAIATGEAKGMVIATGNETVFGSITKLIKKIKKESIYEKDILNFSRLILQTVLATILLIFIANLIIHGNKNLLDFSIFSIALVVSVIPEALPTIVTFSLSRGTLKLAKKHLVVKRLSAIEDLGNIEILCTDKTGTLTENRLTLEETKSYDIEKCLLYGLLASNYLLENVPPIPDPFDYALFKAAPEKILKTLEQFNQVKERPFEASKLSSSALLEDSQEKYLLIVKGAPEMILKLSSVTEKDKKEILREIQEKGRQGKRILAIGYKSIKKSEINSYKENNLKFLGYFVFTDPIKKSTKDAINLAKKLGLKIKILTGDAKEVSGYVAKEIGLIENPMEVITGEKLLSLSENEFEKACLNFSVFARISPETKYKIIDCLRKKYEVGFLGEGINDAPALKASHVALVVDKAADVSKQVADIILLRKDLRVIVEGIKEGRNIFSNINKYIKCTLTSNFGNFYSIAGISLMIPFLPMLPIQILLVNLLSDFPLIAVSRDTVDPEELKKPKLYSLEKSILLIVLLAFISSTFDFIFFGLFHKAEPSLLRTLWFIVSILTEIILIFSVRTNRFFLKAKKPDIYLVLISLSTILITISLPFTRLGEELFHFVKPGWINLLVILGIVISYLILSEIVKLLYFYYSKNNYSQKQTDNI